jgi:hypothetical protein
MFRKICCGAFSTLLCLVLLLGSYSCGDGISVTTDSGAGITGSITVEKSVTAANTVVSTLGDTITISDSSSPLKGMTVVVPPDSYEYPKNFIISYAPIKNHTFGKDFNPATPLITINNGGEYSEELMEVDIPVDVPSGYLAMGLYYNSASGKLEGMATLAQDADSITVGTRHFSDFLVSLIKISELKSDIDSLFRPGIDDWQFVNEGSYIAANGHCAGQAMTAAWYYVTQPDGKDLALYNRYDNNGKEPDTPTLWQDDSYGYRFCSTVQRDIDWDGFAFKFWREQRGINDELTYNLFRYSMQLTGEPQMVGLTKEGAGGHAMICYRIKDGKLYIADPNYPGNLERKIEYEANRLKPYESGANRAEIEAGNSISFDKIGYTGKTSIIDWNKISQRWTEFKAGTIGNDRFPAYTVTYKNEDGVYVELKDGHVATSNLMDINYSALFGGSITIFRDGKVLPYDANFNITLNPGNNLLGIYIKGIVNVGTPQESKAYVDFKYINVFYGEMKISPASQEMEPDISRTFNLELSEAAPQGAYFEWYVDGVLKQSGHDFSISVSFPDAGEYTIVCKMLDNTGKVLQQAQATAIVRAKTTTAFTYNNLTALQNMTKLRLSINGRWEITKWTEYEGETVYDGWLNQTIPYYNPGNPDMPITWSGTAFSGELVTSNSVITRTERVTGTVSADGTTLLSLSYTMTYVSDDLKSNGLWHSEEEITIELVNIPIPQLVFAASTSSTFNFGIYGPNMSNYISEVSWHSITVHDSVTDIEYRADDSTIDWSGEGLQATPTISLSMS